MKWYNSMLSSFLSNYSEKDFVRYKRAQFIFIFASFIILGLIALNIFAVLKMEDHRVLEIFKSSALLLSSCLVIIVLIRKGKMEIAANTLAFTACIIASLGVITRPLHLAGVSMGLFMHLDMAFATLYCSVAVSSLVFTLFAATHIFYYVMISAPAAEGILVETAKDTMFDGILTLFLLFVLGLVTSRFLNQAVEIAVRETGRSKDNYNQIKSLIAAIRKTIAELNSSIEMNHSIITNYSDNAQSQAASVEELSATIEEISAGTESVVRATGEQNESIEDMVESINNLSLSINTIEEYGNKMKITFASFIKKAEEGSQASTLLDAINKKILKNSNDITEVITIIEQFFDKINLLSLNATIEAARAGEHGRGFAVVAEEIGKLADNSQAELNRIGELIDKNKNDSSESNNVINQILQFINGTIASIDSLQEVAVITINALEDQKKMKDDMDRKTDIALEKTEHISMSMKEQSTAIEGIALSIEDTSKIVQQNAENTKELQNGSETLRELAATLETEISS